MSTSNENDNFLDPKTVNIGVGSSTAFDSRHSLPFGTSTEGLVSKKKKGKQRYIPPSSSSGISGISKSSREESIAGSHSGRQSSSQSASHSGRIGGLGGLGFGSVREEERNSQRSALLSPSDAENQGSGTSSKSGISGSDITNEKRQDSNRNLSIWSLPFWLHYWRIFTSRKRYWVSGAAMIFLLAFAIALGVALGQVNGKREDVLITSPPYYPSPKGGWVSEWFDPYQRAAKLVKKMSLLEKVNITTGTGWSMGPCVGNTGATTVGFPPLCLQDGPAGIRFADYVTVFPAGITVAATWSKYLMFTRGQGLGSEARDKGVNVLLGPSIGPLGRFPTGGRNWEGFGPDPYLTGVAAAWTIQGTQSEGVIATAKHFIGNEQERFRQGAEARSWGFESVTESISANIGERALHELYLWPFQEAVKAGVGAVMCSYNQVNNSYACQNSMLLNGVLKGELGFQGFVMSDWLAQKSGVGAALAGLDMSMPGDGSSFLDNKPFWAGYLTEAIANGTIPFDRLDDMVMRIVASWYRMGQHKDHPKPSFSSWTEQKYGLVNQGAMGGPETVVNHFVDVRQNHSATAFQIALESITLLKNHKGSLPLKDDRLPRAMMIFGSDAGPNPYGPNGCVDRTCNNGTLGQGWGSGTVEYTYMIHPLEAIQARLLGRTGPRPMVDFVLDDYDVGRIKTLASVPGAKCFVFVSSDSGEAYASSEGHFGDRNDMYLWHDGDNLIINVASKCNDTVVIIHSVGPVVMEAWIDNPNVTAVIMAHLPASEAGSSLVSILWGDENPSGHLPYTIGKAIEDYGPDGGDIMREPNADVPQDDFISNLDIDYRYFDANSIEPRFEFGYGLSYTTFEYSRFTIEKVIKNLTEFLPPPPDINLKVPQLNSTLDKPRELEFPTGFHRIQNHHYPYLTKNQVSNVLEANVTDYPYPDGYSENLKPIPPGGGGEGGHPALYDVVFHVDIDVKNTGKRIGKTVPQLYVTFPPNIRAYTPVRQLRGFEKIGLGPGESATVGFDIRRKDISLWDESGKGWYIPVGRGLKVGEGFTIFVGQSSRGVGVEGTTPA